MKSDNLNISSSDNELIESYNKGNKQAFNYIVLKYQKTLYKFIIRIMNDHDRTDDALQETFLKLYKSLNSFRKESKLLTYLYRIAFNTSMNHLKKIQKENERNIKISALNYELPDTKEEETDTEKTFNLTKSFDKLPPKQKAVFMMRYFDNLSYEEISEITGTSVGGLKANYFQAIKNLKFSILNEQQKK